MPPPSRRPWILHEQDGGHRHAIERTPGLRLASRFVCPRDLSPCPHSALPILQFAVRLPNHPIPCRVRLPQQWPTCYTSKLPGARQHSIPIGRGAALAAYWKSPYRQCSGPAAWSRYLTTLGPEHCRYSPNDFPTVMQDTLLWCPQRALRGGLESNPP